MVFRARTRDVVAAAAGLGWTNAVTRLLRIAKDRPPFEEIRYRLYPRYMALDFAECSVLVPLEGAQELKVLLTVFGKCATVKGCMAYDKGSEELGFGNSAGNP